LLENARTLDYTVTDSESEALLLEYNLIKEHAPKFNVRYRDDKRYPYLKITRESYPRVVVTRSKEADGGRYFGPYPDGTHVRKILKLVKQFFGLRTCKGDPMREKPCLSLQIGRCVGPCTGKISEGDYRRLADEAGLFLNGKIDELSRLLKGRMHEHSDRLEFEEAARIRDKLGYLEGLKADRKVASGDSRDRDFIAYTREGDAAGVSVFEERGGRIVGHFFFSLDGEFRSDEEESLGSFVKQYYATSPLPDEVVVSYELSDDVIPAGVSVRVPKGGRLRMLLSLVERNARLQVSQDAFGLGRATAAEALARLLGVEAPINRIEGFDVSNISGKLAVASMVVFEGGRPKKSDYRRFRIKTVSGVDDVGMLSEVLVRRLRHEWPRPDVVLVDGGASQVNAARRVLGGTPVVGLAKEHEDLYVGGRRGFVSLPADSPLLRLLMSVRDEAHRFAVTYHRSLRGKMMVSRRKS
jgi:excinuclease ABC subunit C